MTLILLYNSELMPACCDLYKMLSDSNITPCSFLLFFLGGVLISLAT